jgi:hypothetical protein
VVRKKQILEESLPKDELIDLELWLQKNYPRIKSEYDEDKSLKERVVYT